MKWRAVWPRLLLGALTIAITSACSPHEFNDPTAATKRVLYERPAGAPPQEVRPEAPAPGTAGSVDVVELVTGHRIEGTVRQAGVDGVVIEVGGQAIRFEKDRVRAVRFGVAPAPVTKP